MAVLDRVRSLLTEVDRRWPGDFYRRFVELRMLDRVYQVSATTFVALIPLVLALTAAFTGGQQAVAEQVITRFGLAGASADTVRQLLDHQSTGIYWLGLVIVVWSAISLGRKLSSTYCDIWRVPRLRLHQQWRALVWLGVQLALMLAIAWVRDLWSAAGAAWFVPLVALSCLMWWAFEVLSERVLTGGMISWRNLGVAALVVTAGRVGLGVYVVAYLADALSGQAERYGPIGVVFAIFTYIVATVSVLLCGTLLAATWVGAREHRLAGDAPSLE